MSLSPTSGKALFFPFPESTQLYPKKMRRCFHRILRRGCKAVGPREPGSSGYLQALVSLHNGGKPEGATKKEKKYYQ